MANSLHQLLLISQLAAKVKVCSQVSQDALRFGSYFHTSQAPHTQIRRPSSEMVPCCISDAWGMRGCLVCSWPVGHGNYCPVTSLHIPALELGFVGGVVIVLELGLFVMAAAWLTLRWKLWLPLLSGKLGQMLQIFSVIFQISCHFFMVLSALPLFGTSVCSLFFVTQTLIHGV